MAQMKLDSSSKWHLMWWYSVGLELWEKQYCVLLVCRDAAVGGGGDQNQTTLTK